MLIFILGSSRRIGFGMRVDVIYQNIPLSKRHASQQGPPRIWIGAAFKRREKAIPSSIQAVAICSRRLYWGTMGADGPGALSTV